MKDTKSKRNRTLTKFCCVLKKYSDIFISIIIERELKFQRRFSGTVILVNSKEHALAIKTYLEI